MEYFMIIMPNPLKNNRIIQHETLWVNNIKLIIWFFIGLGKKYKTFPSGFVDLDYTSTVSYVKINY